MTKKTDPVSPDLNNLVEKYIALRDKKASIVAAAKEKAAKIDAVLDKVEAVLLASFEELGMDSAKTAAGTAYKSTRTQASVADWDCFRDFVISTGQYEMFEKRASKGAVEAYKDETGELPPGVNYREEITINVRRSS